MSDVMFVKGDIVTDTDMESSFCDKQGQVSRVYPNGTVIVRFPAHMVEMPVWSDENPKPISIAYRGTDVDHLRKDKCWRQLELVQYEAKKIYGHMFHSLNYFRGPFKEGTPCQIEGCDEPAIGRSLVNFVGTIYSFELCKAHKKEWHGIITEGFPDLKKN